MGDAPEGRYTRRTDEATGNPYDPRAIETCCTIAWMALTVDMLRLTGDSLAADELEISSYNAVLGSLNPAGRWVTYNTPMDGQKKASAHDIVFQARAGSPEINCCSVNGPRGLGMLSDWALMAAPDSLTVNFYGPGIYAARIPAGPKVKIVQETGYPREGRVLLKVSPDRARRFALRLRVPNWSAHTRVAVNGEPLAEPQPGRYFKLEREWSPGDTIDIAFDFSLHFWAGERECAERASIYRGPILLAYDPRFDRYDPNNLPPLEAARLKGEPVLAAQSPEPIVLLRFLTAYGQQITLCDFATAGATGTPYISWLPVRGLTPRPFTRENPLRTYRPDGKQP